MFYYILLFISILPATLKSTIAPDELKKLISFIKKTPLTDATHDQFMRYTTRIATDGSPEQQALLSEVLENDNEQTENSLDAVAHILESDIITPDIWDSKVMGVFKKIDTDGSAEQKNNLNNFIQEHKNQILVHGKKLIENLYYDPSVKEALQFIIVNTLVGILPSLGIKSLSILAGNLPLAAASTQLIDLSILCALDSIVRYGLKNQSEYMSGPTAAAISTAVQEFIGFAGPRPTNLSILGATFSTSEMATLQAGFILFAKNNILKTENLTKIIENLDWKDLAFGSTTQLATTKLGETTLIGYLQNTLAPVLKNKTVRAITATTLSYAVESALMAATLNALGLGFYGESTSQAVVTGMIRGALEGLFMHATHGISRPGIVQRVSVGFGVSSVQKYLTTGIMGSSISDLVPLVSQQVLAGAVDGIVQKTGGWKKFVTSLFYTLD